MRYRIAIVGLLCTLVAGCSGGASSSQPAQVQPSVVAAGKASHLIYSVSASNNTIDYYVKGTGPNNPVAGSLSGSFSNPEGIAIDSHGDIYLGELSYAIWRPAFPDTEVPAHMRTLRKFVKVA